MASRDPQSSTKPLSTWQRVSFSTTHAMVRGLLALLGLRGMYRLGRAFGTMEWLINYKRRQRFRRALEVVSDPNAPPSDSRGITRTHFMQTRCDKLFYLMFDCIPRERAMSLFTTTNREWLDTGLADGHGVYVALSHHGAHHVAAMFMALHGYKVAGVRDRHEGGIRRYVQDRFDRRYPEFNRMRVLYADSYPRDVFRCLQDGYVLGSAMDISRIRNEHQKTVELTMFGETRPFLTGPLKVAVRCRALVVQAFIIPEPDFCYRMELVQRLIEPDHVDNEELVLDEALKTYARNIETRVRAMPALLTRL